jgi:hypothetical protein
MRRGKAKKVKTKGKTNKQTKNSVKYINRVR